jgi:hypothetical protein
MYVTCNTHEEGEKYVQHFDNESSKEKVLGRPSCVSEESIKVDYRKIGYEK